MKPEIRERDQRLEIGDWRLETETLQSLHPSSRSKSILHYDTVSHAKYLVSALKSMLVRRKGVKQQASEAALIGHGLSSSSIEHLAALPIIAQPCVLLLSGEAVNVSDFWG